MTTARIGGNEGDEMGILVSLVGGLTILVSLLHFGAAKSAMHETTAAVLWIGGWAMLALGVGLERLRKLLFAIAETKPGTASAPDA